MGLGWLTESETYPLAVRPAGTAVQSAAVVAKPDAKWGETPCAFVETRPGAQVTAEEIMVTARSRPLAALSAPKGPP